MKKPQFSFGLVSDVQYAKQPSYNPKKRPSQLGVKKLADAVEGFNKHDLSFVVNLGDLIDRDPANFPVILKEFDKLKHPIYHVLGNHDFCDSDYSYGLKSEALEALRMTETSRYYSFEVNDWKFIVLDTNEVGVIEHKKDTTKWLAGQKYLQNLEAQGLVNAKEWNGAISQEQVNWLKNEIKSADKAQQKVIIFAHHPIYPKHRENALNSHEMLEILKPEKHVKAYINGHNHSGNFGVTSGLPCWTIEGMMDYQDKTAYAIVEVHQDRLNIKGFGRTKNRDIIFR